MTEWRMIPGFERYEVSDDGRVRYAATQRERKLHVTYRGPAPTLQKRRRRENELRRERPAEGQPNAGERPA